MDRVTQVATVMIALGVWATLGWLVLTRWRTGPHWW